jgi:predicted NBD/HSP70 family sugar kinase
VSTILEPLIKNQLLVEMRGESVGVGRKAFILDFSARTALTVGIAINQEECEVALVDLSARVLDRASATYPRYSEPHEIVDIAASLLATLLHRTGSGTDLLVGVGVTVPGLMDSTTGLVHVAANLGWRNVQLCSLFELKLHLPAYVEQLAKAKLHFEAIWGQGKGRENFVCLEIGSGIGAGVMADGRILRGARGSATEVGHTLIDPSGPRCSCGLNGCWESFCAAPAIRRRLAEHLSTGRASASVLSPSASLAAIGRAAKMDDPVARLVVDETARYLARGVVGIIYNFDPELIILSGSVIRDCPTLIDATRAALRAMEAARDFDIPLLPATQETTAAVVAASAIVSVRYLETLA